MAGIDTVRGRSFEEQLAYLNALRYEIVLKSANNTHYLMIRELSLVATGPKLDAVYADLAAAKERYFRSMLQSGSLDDIVLPRGVLLAREWMDQLKMFAAKMLILAVLIGFSGAFVASVVANKLSGIANKTFARDLVYNISEQLDKVVNLPEQYQVERREKIRQFAIAVRPLLKEFKDAFSASGKEDGKVQK